MITDLRGVKALQQLRLELEESAGQEFPESCLPQMLLLYDVCKHLEIPLHHAQGVLGSSAYKMVTDHINRPIGSTISGEACRLEASGRVFPFPAASFVGRQP
jgi:hypothetical protein